MSENLVKSIGQLLMIGLAGPRLSAKEKAFVKKYQPSGFIYFRRNVKSPEQLAKLSQDLVSVSLQPPLIGIDQEGGRVCRLQAPFTVWPGNRPLGNIYRRTGRLVLARKQAMAMAHELKAIGVNYNFTPVADVDSNPRNPIIGERSFSSKPSQVARLVEATIRGYEQAGVISCAKHFPGHGDAASDSHLVLPVVRASRLQMSRRELVPFRAAIAAKVPTLMTAHVIYPEWDKRPATLSSVFMQDLLRQQLGFKGVLVSDDLEMNAIAKHGKLATAAVEALTAGVDLLLVCKSLEEAKKVLEGISSAVQSGELGRSRVEEALSRVRRLKAKYLEKRGRNSGLAGIPRQGWPEHQALARRIEVAGK